MNDADILSFISFVVVVFSGICIIAIKSRKNSKHGCVSIDTYGPLLLPLQVFCQFLFTVC